MLNKILSSLALISLSLVAASCSKNPVTQKNEVHLLSESQEIEIGEQNYRLMQQAQGGPDATHQALEAYVDRLGQRLAKVSDRPQLPYEFVVLNNSVPNAWALPGGKIAINRGLLLELHSESELAAVLAHEIVHSAARHGAKSIERNLLMQTGLLGLQQVLKDHKYEDVALRSGAVASGLTHFKYNRVSELEADKYGIKYMVEAGYDPQAAVTLQEMFLKLSENKHSSWFTGLFATHPPSEERIQENIATVATYPPGGKVGVEPFEEAMALLRKDKKAYENLDRGYAAFVKGKIPEALALVEEGIKLQPKEAHFYNLKGKIEVRRGLYQEAMSSFNKAIELNSDYYDFYLERGLLRYDLGEIELAKIDLERSQFLLPSGDGHYFLGMIELKLNNPSIALGHFQKAALVSSKAGRLAKVEMAKLDVPSRPNDYLLATPEVDMKGKVLLQLASSSGARVNQLLVELSFFNAKKMLISKRMVRVDQQIQPFQKITVPTSLLAPSGTATIEAQVVQAKTN